MSNIANGLQYFVLIAEQKKKDKYLTLLSEHGAHAIETVYAHGSVGTSAIAAAFGFVVEQNKVMITCLLKNDKAQELIEILYKKYEFCKPNTGIAFTISVLGLAF